MNLNNRLGKLEQKVENTLPDQGKKKDIAIVIIEPDEDQAQAIERWEAGTGRKLDLGPKKRYQLPSAIFVELVKPTAGTYAQQK